uniref:Uncharacterized protein n=1 Tax=Oryza punctata TaxID=4537 RepID=A0A0E0LAR4_ORYPU
MSTDSSNSSPTSPRSTALNSVVNAVADAVRSSFLPTEGSQIDLGMTTAVADDATQQAVAAACRALATLFPPTALAVSAVLAPPVPSSTPPPAIALDGSSLTNDLAALLARLDFPVAGSTTVPPTFQWPGATRPSGTPGGGSSRVAPIGVPGAIYSSTFPAPDTDARAALHYQAIGVLNVKSIIPVVLDVQAANYTKWRGIFLVALGKYDLQDHVLADVQLPTTPIGFIN